MLINPENAIERGIITFPSYINIDDYDKYIQPNAIDFTCDIVSEWEYQTGNTFIISDELNMRQMRTTTKVQPQRYFDEYDTSFFELQPQTSYDVQSNFYVHLPAGVAAMIIVRSTYNRNVAFMTAGLYDSGYHGPIGGVLHNMGKESIYVGEGTRVAQIMFIESNSAHLYDGNYNSPVTETIRLQ